MPSECLQPAPQGYDVYGVEADFVGGTAQKRPAGLKFGPSQSCGQPIELCRLLLQASQLA